MPACKQLPWIQTICFFAGAVVALAGLTFVQVSTQVAAATAAVKSAAATLNGSNGPVTAAPAASGATLAHAGAILLALAIPALLAWWFGRLVPDDADGASPPGSLTPAQRSRAWRLFFYLAGLLQYALSWMLVVDLFARRSTPDSLFSTARGFAASLPIALRSNVWWLLLVGVCVLMIVLPLRGAVLASAQGAAQRTLEPVVVALAWLLMPLALVALIAFDASGTLQLGQVTADDRRIGDVLFSGVAADEELLAANIEVRYGRRRVGEVISSDQPSPGGRASDLRTVSVRIDADAADAQDALLQPGCIAVLRRNAVWSGTDYIELIPPTTRVPVADDLQLANGFFVPGVIASGGAQARLLQKIERVADESATVMRTVPEMAQRQIEITREQTFNEIRPLIQRLNVVADESTQTLRTTRGFAEDLQQKIDEMTYHVEHRLEELAQMLYEFLGGRDRPPRKPPATR